MNITDVEDKIIKRVREPARPARVCCPYEDAFLSDLGTLACLRARTVPGNYRGDGRHH
jgi:cysteinyl-tRNA synthetase